jgi:methane/ammonia monooxygenase subunit C
MATAAAGFRRKCNCKTTESEIGGRDMNTMTAVQGAPSAGKISAGRFFVMRGAVFAMLGILALMVFLRVYQQMFAFTAGLDSTLPAFDTYWMNLMRVELTVIVASYIGLWSYIWFTRDKHLDQLSPAVELKRYFTLLFFILVYTFSVYFAGSFFAEQDAAWHQTVVRDTSFTPSHIVLFYGTMPLYVLFGVGSFLYAMTRLPAFAKSISIPFVIAVVGPFLILPNLGYNEFAHAFWQIEEVFSAPVHWGFVVMAWSVLGLGGLLVQIVQGTLSAMRRVDAGIPGVAV